jgi:hypothetical protein
VDLGRHALGRGEEVLGQALDQHLSSSRRGAPYPGRSGWSRERRRC